MTIVLPGFHRLHGRRDGSQCTGAGAAITAPQVPEQHSPDVTVTGPVAVRRAVKAAALGNAMEWFGFGVDSHIP
ncbi:hypothetical protein [Streptomyces sp. NPDC087294]|uniref:hypothetical protein n=1 Tax=Streptomyces sp. NPDC087294 TaxID=3365777 RepID=UPI0037F6F730